jgi:hypothetical protein
MKKIVMCAMILLGATGAYAYDMTETLIGANAENGIYVAPVFRYTQLSDTWGLMFGGRAAWVINHVFSIGGGYYVNAPDNIKPVIGATKYTNDLSYGGLELEYIIEPDDLVHASLVALLGSGKTVLKNDATGATTDDASFFVLEPGINAELNLAKHLRVDLGVYYRMVTGVDTPRLSNSKVGGLSFALLFKLGGF